MLLRLRLGPRTLSGLDRVSFRDDGRAKAQLCLGSWALQTRRGRDDRASSGPVTPREGVSTTTSTISRTDIWRCQTIHALLVWEENGRHVKIRARIRRIFFPHEGHGGTPRGRSIFPLASSAQGNIQHAASGTWKRLEDNLLGLTDGCDRKLRLSSRAA